MKEAEKIEYAIIELRRAMNLAADREDFMSAEDIKRILRTLEEQVTVYETDTGWYFTYENEKGIILCSREYDSKEEVTKAMNKCKVIGALCPEEFKEN